MSYTLASRHAFDLTMGTASANFSPARPPPTTHPRVAEPTNLSRLTALPRQQAIWPLQPSCRPRCSRRAHSRRRGRCL